MKTHNTLKSLLVLAIMAGGVGTVSMVQNAAADETDMLEKTAEAPSDFERKVNRTVENIESGVMITLTTDDAEELKRLQSMTEMPMHGHLEDWMADVDQAFNLLDNGVQITLTSDDPSIVDKLQHMPTDSEGKGHHGPMGMLFGKDLNRSVENIENGVVITLTSDDPKVVEGLQNFDWEHHAPQAEEQE